MTKLTIEILIAGDEAGSFRAELDDLCQDFGASYLIADDAIPPTLRDTDPAPAGYLQELCGSIWADVVEPDPRPSIGDLVEISGFEYVVYLANIEGEMILKPRDELVDDA